MAFCHQIRILEDELDYNVDYILYGYVNVYTLYVMPFYEVDTCMCPTKRSNENQRHFVIVARLPPNYTYQLGVLVHGKIKDLLLSPD